ncbi:AbrB/MazE/SpoVT family DNA-binding domain-containing protein [Companilactobacillus nodensis]|uniref:SpoVT-AbrB domain-containing protein n=1 Tax=Companilactobacillus nodensis DSM 19682 = JCM 14932 = NBRC 107160 TaxID=1423775 RepID=A0A0R1K9W2_9LACO|nr:AbrB/MazE/SpoVT family DNA-binding domain-containing protein [Companilactobacillus nodensis]KRK80463.1 hypothetical protein FD03_GL001887 [Companilactobacillus nodensis DSM 19682 = JCM 14932 = NBRC 107160]
MDVKNRENVVVAKVTSKNQITIPKEIRTKLNLKKHDNVEFVTKDNGEVVIKSKNDLWSVVKEQEKKYGNLSTPEIDWGEDVGVEVID